MRHMDGFISAKFHRSLDSKYVAEYVQWASKEAYDAMLKDERAQVHMKTVTEIAISFPPILYHLVHADE